MEYVPNLARHSDMRVSEDERNCQVCADDDVETPTEYFVNDTPMCAEHAREELEL